MAANIEKISQCFRALGSFLGNILSLKFPLWLYIVASLAAVLFFLCVGCAHDRMMQRVVVGHVTDNGHSYILCRPENNDGVVAVVHDPDCFCHFIENVEEDGSI